SAPTGPVSNPKCLTPTKHSCAIQWGPVETSLQNGVMLGYNISYMAGGALKFVVVGDSSVLTKEINGLDVFTEYTFVIRAYNKFGLGNETQITCKSGEGAPSAPPQNLSGVPESSTAISITFGDIPERDQNGKVVYYLVCFYERALGNSTIQCLVVENTRSRREASFDQHSKTITGLKPYTEYVVQVLGHTIKDGVYSDPITVTTAEDGGSRVR
ncbi:predicted protein, partial [Nematostella vectensis]